MAWTYQKQEILRRDGKNTQKNCIAEFPELYSSSHELFGLRMGVGLALLSTHPTCLGLAQSLTSRGTTAIRIGSECPPSTW